MMKAFALAFCGVLLVAATAHAAPASTPSYVPLQNAVSIPLGDRLTIVTALGVDSCSAVFWHSSGPPAFTFTVGPALSFVHIW